MTAKTCFLGLFIDLFVAFSAQAADVRGVVLKVDAEKNQLTIEGRGLGVRGAIMAIQLDKNTQIQAGGFSAALILTNQTDTLRGKTPRNVIRSIIGTIGDDQNFATVLGIIERQRIFQLLVDDGNFVVRGDQQRDRGKLSRGKTRGAARRNPRQQSHQRRIGCIAVQKQGGADPKQNLERELWIGEHSGNRVS